MMLLLNPHAGGGKALRSWEEIAGDVVRKTGPVDILITGRHAQVQHHITHLLARGERRFIAAGGDGTVNMLLNLLLNALPREEWHTLRLGAIGLGSSNDFHKPFSPDGFIRNVPCRLRFDRATPKDLGKLEYVADGETKTAWFISNAAIGVTADANDAFNNPARFLAGLKRISTPAAILHAAVMTILRSRSFSADLSVGGCTVHDAAVTNLAILKNPNVSGSFCYPAGCTEDDGLFSIHLLSGMNRRELLTTLYSLSRHRLNGSPRHRVWTSAEIRVSSTQSFAVEYDGEVIHTNDARFTVIPKSLKVCPC